jgi:hypothetical protein
MIGFENKSDEIDSLDIFRFIRMGKTIYILTVLSKTPEWKAQANHFPAVLGCDLHVTIVPTQLP